MVRLPHFSRDTTDSLPIGNGSFTGLWYLGWLSGSVIAAANEGHAVHVACSLLLAWMHIGPNHGLLSLYGSS